MFYRKYVFGDTAIVYFETPVAGREGETTVALTAFPDDYPIDLERCPADGMIQVAFTGDEALVDYSNGVTMLNRSATVVHIEKQESTATEVVTTLSDGNGNKYVHTLSYHARFDVFSVYIAYENASEEVRTLEHLSSCTLGGICKSGEEGLSTADFTLHRMTSAWSRECRLQSAPFSALGLDASWAKYGVKCERWGQIGSMSNRGYYPFAVIEGDGLFWGMTVEAPFSWQMEVCLERDCCTLSGGLGDYEFAHWRKRVKPRGSFVTRRAFFTLQRDFNAVCNAFVHEFDSRLSVPPAEEDMPVIFNEYCTTWGNPTAERIEEIVDAVKDFPVSYFVIDSGWYKPEDKGWCNAIGDWNENRSYFPEGISKVVETINDAGMKAGIWFEFEVSGRDSEFFRNENAHIKRDGKVITSKNRRFLDICNPDVQKYLDEKVFLFLRKNGFEYLKIDYNDTFGMGCDGADEDGLPLEPGEGGRLIAEKSVVMLDLLKDVVPDLVIENCASGGSRIEPLRMGKVSMCSFSDAHECPEIPLVAANVSRVVPARQMQIWAVLREGESNSRTVYSLCAAMLGRICLSGDVVNLPAEKRKLILRGLSFYEEIKEIVRDGDIVSVETDVKYYRDPVGYQVYIKDLHAKRLVVVHRLKSSEDISIVMRGYKLVKAYTDCRYSYKKGELVFGGGEYYQAGAFLFTDE